MNISHGLPEGEGLFDKDLPVSPAQENTPQWRFACMCGVTWLPATAPDRCPECGRRADLICEHGNAVDMHCCNCHSGFIFDKDHECPELAQQPDYWRCRTCGCVWRDNHDDSVSLGGPTQKSCERCEMSPTAQECDPLYLAVSPAQARETTQEQLQMLREALRLQAVSARSVTGMAGMSEAHKEFYRGKACGIEQASESVRLLLTASPGIAEKDDPTKYWALRLAAAVKLNGEYFRRIQELEAQLAAPGITTPSEQERK